MVLSDRTRVPSVDRVRLAVAYTHHCPRPPPPKDHATPTLVGGWRRTPRSLLRGWEPPPYARHDPRKLTLALGRYDLILAPPFGRDPIGLNFNDLNRSHLRKKTATRLSWRMPRWSELPP